MYNKRKKTHLLFVFLRAVIASLSNTHVYISVITLCNLLDCILLGFYALSETNPHLPIRLAYSPLFLFSVNIFIIFSVTQVE